VTLDNDTLVALAEVSVGLTGFIGFVTVLGSRSQGEWSPLDNIRFWSLMLSSLTPIALGLIRLPIQQCYLALIFWCMTIAIIVFVRLLRSVRPAA
jgi:hypothetical protein